MRIKLALVLILIFGASLVASAQSLIPDSVRTPLNITFTGYRGDTSYALGGLRSELASILPATRYRRMTPSCKVVLFEPDNSIHPIYAVNQDMAVMPASVEKLFTTSTTLWALGSDYKFSTKLDLLPSARVEGSSVIGSIYLRPSGDPTLSVNDFDELAIKLKSTGVTQIEGDIVSDLTNDHILTADAQKYFADHTELPATTAGGGDSLVDVHDSLLADENADAGSDENQDAPDEDQEVAGFLSSSPNFFIDRNIISVHVVAGSKKGMSAHVSITPPISGVRVINHARTSAPVRFYYRKVRIGRGRHARYRKVRAHTRSSYTLHITTSGTANDPEQTIVISGVIPARLSRTFNVPIKNVPQAMAALLKWRLEENGIRVTGTARSGEPPKGVTDYKTIAVKETPLLDLLQVTNKRSDNFLAESMFRKLSSISDVSASNPAERSRKLIHSWMNVIDVNCKDGYCADGSGLSHDNHTTAEAVIDLLRGIRSRPRMYPDFVSTLSIAGVDGTTRGRMIGSPAQFNARSKTGTLNAVTALAGYVSTQDGQLAAYFITMQNLRGGAKMYKAIQNQIVQKIAGFKYSDYAAKYSPTPVTAAPTFTAPDTPPKKNNNYR
ncbi:MAG TPA: D-alanyl-D-alanine carboxypeptidase/D-alanyl-D-alanine-endopeptidase [Candidatus Kapabacteria bacterium]|nr:D-alanyl-D-alanine carboxypeptidase/D-alanyl-D-alanine-endopeptidase [Candidatus Kapabacteria bacterium]